MKYVYSLPVFMIITGLFRGDIDPTLAGIFIGIIIAIIHGIVIATKKVIK